MSLTLVLAGGMLKPEGALLIDTARAVVHEVEPRVVIVLPELEPAVRALLLALEATGEQVHQRIQRNIESTPPEELLMQAR